jgi:hypothetical protein
LEEASNSAISETDIKKKLALSTITKKDEGYESDVDENEKSADLINLDKTETSTITGSTNRANQQIHTLFEDKKDLLNSALLTLRNVFYHPNPSELPKSSSIEKTKPSVPKTKNISKPTNLKPFLAATEEETPVLESIDDEEEKANRSRDYYESTTVKFSFFRKYQRKH